MSVFEALYAVDAARSSHIYFSSLGALRHLCREYGPTGVSDHRSCHESFMCAAWLTRWTGIPTAASILSKSDSSSVRQRRKWIALTQRNLLGDEQLGTR